MWQSALNSTGANHAHACSYAMISASKLSWAGCSKGLSWVAMGKKKKMLLRLKKHMASICLLFLYGEQLQDSSHNQY